MRVILFFDLPTITYADRKAYRLFHKFLINEGFIMMQESVYCKLALNKSVLNGIMKKVRANVPHHGDVQVLTVTEKQFTQIEYLVGQKKKEKEDSEERLIIL